MARRDEQMTSPPALVLEPIGEDAQFFLRLFKTLVEHPGSALIGPAVVPLACMFVVESHARLSEYSSTCAPILSDAALSALRPARHRAKMLLSSNSDVDELVAQFDAIVEAERDRFMGGHSGWLGWLRRWVQPDLGVSLCAGHVFSTTHATQFLFDSDFSGPSLRESARELARYCSILVGTLCPGLAAPPFVAPSFGVVMRDVKCEAFYRRGPLGGLELPWAGVVAAVLCNVNFVDKVLRRLVEGESRTFVKIRVLCAFHAIESLRLVQDRLISGGRLPNAASAVLKSIATAETRWFRKHRELRNTLVHFQFRAPPLPHSHMMRLSARSAEGEVARNSRRSPTARWKRSLVRSSSDSG